jgi:hypothetical protein
MTATIRIESAGEHVDAAEVSRGLAHEVEAAAKEG